MSLQSSFPSSPKFSAVIIEDEPLAAERLANLIRNRHPEYHIQFFAETVRDSIEHLIQHQPDVIFCDIHLADGISFEIFERIKIQAPVIFTTAYDEYTLDAFDINSIHYLLKPIDENDLAKALKKFEAHHSDHSRDLDRVVRKMLTQKTKRFLLKAGQRIVPKKEDELAFFFIQNKVVHAADITEGKVYMTDFTLEQLESEMLSKDHFFRINRKQIVNKDAVVSLKPYPNQRLSLSLTIPCSHELVLSREKVNQFKKWITDSPSFS
ncbi:MAG: LytTR family DNA-binding domain-containing protein [Ekhidna sp.]